jgi:hypothetical protein
MGSKVSKVFVLGQNYRLAQGFTERITLRQAPKPLQIRQSRQIPGSSEIDF